MKSYIYVGVLQDIRAQGGFEVSIVHIRADNEQEAHDLGRLRFDSAAPLVKFAVAEVDSLVEKAKNHADQKKGDKG